MGSISDAYDAVAESFFHTRQLELLDENHSDTRDQLANAIFDRIEAWYNPHRRHAYCGQLSPIDYEATTAA
jgi:putative transposase